MTPITVPVTPPHDPPHAADAQDPTEAPKAFEPGPPASEPDDSSAELPPPPDDVDTATAPLD